MGRRRIHFPERPWRSRTLGCCPEAGGNVGCSIQRRFQANSDTVRDIGRSVTARSNEAYDTSPPPRPCSTPRGLVREKSYGRARTRASLARRPLPGLDLHPDPEREHRVPSSTDPAGTHAGARAQPASHLPHDRTPQPFRPPPDSRLDRWRGERRRYRAPPFRPPSRNPCRRMKPVASAWLYVSSGPAASNDDRAWE